MVMMNGQYCRDKDGCFYAHPLPQEGLRELLPWLEKTDIAVSVTMLGNAGFEVFES